MVISEQMRKGKFEVFRNEFFEVSEEGVYSKIVESDKCSQEIVLHLKVVERPNVTILEERICQGGTYNKNGLYNGININHNKQIINVMTKYPRVFLFIFSLFVATSCLISSPS